MTLSGASSSRTAVGFVFLFFATALALACTGLAPVAPAVAAEALGWAAAAPLASTSAAPETSAATSGRCGRRAAPRSGQARSVTITEEKEQVASAGIIDPV